MGPRPFAGTRHDGTNVRWHVEKNSQFVHKIILNCSQICARARISYDCPGTNRCSINDKEKRNVYSFPSSYFTPLFGKVIILFCSFIILSIRQPQPHSQTSVEWIVVKWSVQRSLDCAILPQFGHFIIFSNPLPLFL